MDVYKLNKEDLDAFIQSLRATHEVIAPKKTDVTRFEKIQTADEIEFQEQSYTPVKSFFFAQEEVLFNFAKDKITVPTIQAKRQVFFGLRRCDLNGIRHQDIVFQNDIKDPYYTKRREQSLLIGYHCNTAPSEYCFCGSLELVDCFDLMFYDRQDHFLVEIGTQKGEQLLTKHFQPHNRQITQDEKIIPGADRLENKNIKGLYDNPGWQEGVDKCLSCAACTSLCPTCYCFEIHDEPKMANLEEGERKRTWSSCQLQSFTRVAGDHVFRDKREDRFKHRIYHQLDYFKDKYGIDLCVGCGRCISGCPTKIDFVEIINGMQAK